MRSDDWELGNHLNICLKTEESQENVLSRWLIAGLSGCALTSSEQSGKQEEVGAL
jgi:hypothetical protein